MKISGLGSCAAWALALGVGIASAGACSSTSTSEVAATPDAAASAPAAPFSLTPITAAHIGSDSTKPDFHVASGDVDLTGGPFMSANLVVDLATTCFPFAQWKTDPPPTFQNFPATCDAFDRNFELAFHDPAAAATAPGLEVIRAITPFGGPLHIERDITDVVNALHAMQRLDIMIPSYSDGAGKISGSNGGWTVTARIDLVPGPAPNNVLGVFPLVYDDQTKGGITRSSPFTLPAGTTSARVEYLATGHGSATDATCNGPADEFCERLHTLTADGAVFMDKKALWRTDCASLCTVTQGGPFGSYCLENPCGAPQSVDASRANWCPGSETPPLVFTPAQLATPGAHSIDMLVNAIADGGSWEISLKVFALGN